MSEVLQKTNDRLDELKADGVHVSILFITSFTFAHVPLFSCNELKRGKCYNPFPSWMLEVIGYLLWIHILRIICLILQSMLASFNQLLETCRGSNFKL